ncbi:type IV pilus biogenesis protein PilM [Mangrovitalea sediminis]|uniref:hypothetical protein n=1 Tax=Mangrovitalea sediminis TaxID=1982043 RepID=UPI001D0CE880|nr:hypothetical protein [Mangrovitalea sediminis]
MSFRRITHFFRRQQRTGRLGLEVRPDGIAWAELSASGALVATGFENCTPAGRLPALTALVETRRLQGSPVDAVVSVDHYQIFQIERPAVEDNELVDAVRWRLKDLLDYSPDDAVFDVFPFPEDAARGRGALINVVSARKSLIRELAKLTEEAALTLARVDIAELALRNLAARLESGNRCVALVYLRSNHGQVVLTQGPVLYLSRRIDVTAESLSDVVQQEMAVQGLALELQRSLDYYESQMGQVPPRQIHLLARADGLPLAEMLNVNLAAEVVRLDPARVGIPELDERSVLACAALLSDQGVTA